MCGRTVLQGRYRRRSALDTRSKIVEQSALSSIQGVLHLACGWFDVLTAEHCRLLQAAKPADGTLLVLVYRESSTRPAPLRAFDRAQMIAALACVDRVVVCEQSDVASMVADLGPIAVVEIESRQRRDVIRDVLECQR